LRRVGSEERRAEREEKRGKSREIRIRRSMLCALRPKLYTRGFTLVEVSIVIFIMLLMTSATVPWMRTFAESTRLRGTARSIRSLIEFARTSAITQRTEYVVLFDPDQGEYWLSLMEFLDAESGEVVSDASRTSLADSLAALEEENADDFPDEDDGEETEVNFSRTGGILGIPKQIPGGISIVKISSPRSSGREGEVEYIAFRPNGTSEDFEVYLQSGTGRVFLLTVAKTTGRTRTRELTVEEIDELGLVISE